MIATSFSSWVRNLKKQRWVLTHSAKTSFLLGLKPFGLIDTMNHDLSRRSGCRKAAKVVAIRSTKSL
jgi:hypothetical protein